MVELPVEELQRHLQAHLNYLEFCKALKKQTSDSHVKKALDLLIDDSQESLASLASHLRQLGAAPGAVELDAQGRARIREVLAMRSLSDQLLAVRRGLADLVAWYEAHLPAYQANPAADEWPASLSARAHRMLDGWDRHMDEMKVTR